MNYHQAHRDPGALRAYLAERFGCALRDHGPDADLRVAQIIAQEIAAETGTDPMDVLAEAEAA